MKLDICVKGTRGATEIDKAIGAQWPLTEKTEGMQDKKNIYLPGQLVLYLEHLPCILSRHLRSLSPAAENVDLRSLKIEVELSLIHI